MPVARLPRCLIVLDPLYSTLFMSPFWSLEFWGGCYVFGKGVHLWCLAYITLLEAKVEIKPHVYHSLLQRQTVPTSSTCVSCHYIRTLHLVITTAANSDVKHMETVMRAANLRNSFQHSSWGWQRDKALSHWGMWICSISLHKNRPSGKKCFKFSLHMIYRNTQVRVLLFEGYE
jgi:hypothetical protein